jgi:hypothetical protein
MKAILLLTLLTSVWMHPAYAFLGLGMTQFQKACRDGADARVQFCVVDDTGLPVANARVNVFFDMIDRSKGKRVIGCTDTNGVFIAEAKTGGVLEIEVTGDGYYKTTDKMCFIEMENEHDVQEGKWQPWGMRKNIVLLPIKNPSAIRRPPSWKGCKELNKWIGFDLMISDFIKPYGKGEIADMEVMFEWDGLWRQKDYNGMTVKIRFSEKFSGGYYDNKVAGSEYTGVYHANLKKKYHQEFKYSERVISRNKKGYPSKYEKHMFDETKVLVVRSRCRLNDDGTLKSANYFQLSYIKFAGDEQGAAMKFMSIFNPTPNDTNLEPKR